MPSVLAQAAARALQWRFVWGQAPGAPAALWNCAISEVGRLGGHGWALPKMGQEDVLRSLLPRLRPLGLSPFLGLGS